MKAAPARRALYVEEGNYVKVHITDDSIVLMPKKLVDKSLAYFWSASWQAAGRFNIADDVNNLLAKLDKGRKKNRRSRRGAQETKDHHRRAVRAR